MEFSEARKIYIAMEYVDVLRGMVEVLKVETYVELGVQKAYTFNRISPYVKRAVAVDIKQLPNVVKLDHVEIYIMSTVEFSKIWKDSIDFLFIDACHDKERVLEDFRLFAPFVRDDTGVIALHDTYPMYKELTVPSYCSNAWEAVEEIKNFTKNRKFEIFTLPGPYAGITFVRKVTKSLIWK
jgi:predicted O-methyltransferase YrrM